MPSLPLTEISVGLLNDASPYANSTLLALNSVLTPPTFELTTSDLNFATPSRLTLGLSTVQSDRIGMFDVANHFADVQ